MPATKIWASSNGDLADVNSYAPSGVPAKDDFLHFTGFSQAPVTQNLTALSEATLTGALGGLYVAEAYHGQIASEGTPIKTTAREIVHRGTGAMYLDSSSPAILQNVVVDSTNTKNAMVIVGNSPLLYLFCKRGRTVVGTRFIQDLASLVVQSDSGPAFAPVVDLLTNSAKNLYQLVMSGDHGIVNSYRGTVNVTDRWVVLGGTLRQEQGAVGNLVNRGRVIWNSPSPDKISNMINGGVLDFTKTFSPKLVDTLYVLRGGNVLSGSHVTVSFYHLDLNRDFPFVAL